MAIPVFWVVPVVSVLGSPAVGTAPRCGLRVWSREEGFLPQPGVPV